MKANRLLVVLGLALFLSSDVFAHEFFVKIIGQTQGNFKGENAAGQIPIIGYDFHVNTPIDSATGQPSGKRQYDPITITKGLDLASPELLRALITNEVLTKVVIEAYVASKDGKVTRAYTITLTNAYVV